MVPFEAVGILERVVERKAHQLFVSGGVLDVVRRRACARKHATSSGATRSKEVPGMVAELRALADGRRAAARYRAS